MSVFFNGRLITTPTTASVVNDDAMRNQNLSVGNVAALVGRSAGGKPKTALRFGSPQEAQDTLVSGELLDAVLVAFDPSSQTGGPAEVVAVRVNPATPATGVLKDAGGNDVISLASTGYGIRENLIKHKIEAGTVSGRRITTQRGNDYYSQDNVGRAAFSVHYTGAEATATITVNGTQAVLAAPAGTTVATLSFAEFGTVQDLVDRINLVAGFSAEVLDSSYTKPTLNGLDFVTAQSVKTAYTVRADLQAAVDWFNSASEGFVTATRVAGAGAPPAVSAFAFLSGGSDGTTTFNDWADAYEVLQAVDVQWVTPVSSDAAIHALHDSHLAYMSNVGLKERRGHVGTDVSTSADDAKAAAKALNSDRTSVVFQGHYGYGSDGKLALHPPYITAALLTGMASGVNPGTSLTNKAIKCNGIEFDLRNPTDTDELINAGVTCIENTDEGYKVVQHITSCLWSDNYNRVEQSTGAAVDYTMRTWRKALDVLRGEKNSPLLLSRAISISETALRELARPEPEGPGVLVGDAKSSAYRNLKASIEGDVLRVSGEISPAIPNNYVLVTAYAVPYSGTATA